MILVELSEQYIDIKRQEIYYFERKSEQLETYMKNIVIERR